MFSPKIRWTLLIFVISIAFSIAAAPAKAPAAVASDGTVTGTLIVNGTKYTLSHVYGRKREAWPSDAKLLSAGDVDALSCGIVEILFTNTPLAAKDIASILQNDYQGSDKIRGVRFLIDGSGKYKWAMQFLLESGSVTAFGMTQTQGSISAEGSRFKGQVSCKNEQVTQVRTFDISFDTETRMQFMKADAENAEPISEDQFAEVFVTMLPGEWTIERWLGLTCWSATGTLEVGERINPHEFQGQFHIKSQSGQDIVEEGTFSIKGSKVHFEGGKVSVPETAWTRDVLDFDLRKNVMTSNGSQSYLVLRKKTCGEAEPPPDCGKEKGDAK